MGKDLHECVVTGRVTKLPEMRYTPGGMAITNVDLAVADDYFKKEEKEWESRTNFFRFTAFSDAAERLAAKVGVGDRLLIRYTIKNANYVNKEGNKVYKDQMTISTYQVVEKRSGSEGNESAPKQEKSAPKEKPVNDDDIPF